MAKMKAGFIGIIGREGDKWAQLEQAAKIGFKGTENAEMYFLDAEKGSYEDNVKRYRDLGMEPLTASTLNGPSLKEAGVDSIIARAHRMGVERAVVFHGAAYYAKGGKVVTYDEVMSEIEMLQEAAAKCKAEGIKLAYHNHDHEFLISFNGLTVFDMLLAYAPDLWLELDVGWATFAGLNPVDVLHRVAPRLSAVHFKDFIPGGTVQAPVPMLDRTMQKTFAMPNFCSLGSGALDVHGCLKACTEIGIEYAICEQDFMHVLTPMETLQVDYLVMKESGYLE